MTEYLNTVCDIAEQMLKSGAEVHRVEESLTRMCVAVGAVRADVFIITSSIVVTAYADDERSFTETRRIKNIGTDMEKLHRLNDLSRRICSGGMALEEIRAEYDKILSQKAYPLWLEFAAFALIGGSFALFFGGGPIEGLLAALIGLVLRAVTLFSDKTGMGRIFCRFACSFVLTMLSYIFLKFGIISSVDNIIIGNIMVLIPGIGLTNSLRDLFVGDSIAGLLRLIEAVLITLAIVAGHFLFITLFKGVLF